AMSSLVQRIEAHLAVTAALGDEPQSLGEISRSTGVPKTTVHDHCHALAEIGRARQIPGGWVRVVTDDFEANGAERCPVCRKRLEHWGGRLICINPQCPGETREAA